MSFLENGPPRTQPIPTPRMRPIRPAMHLVHSNSAHQANFGPPCTQPISICRTRAIRPRRTRPIHLQCTQPNLPIPSEHRTLEISVTNQFCPNTGDYCDSLIYQFLCSAEQWWSIFAIWIGVHWWLISASWIR